jgi:type 1 glutamine amidotransferase
MYTMKSAKAYLLFTLFLIGFTIQVVAQKQFKALLVTTTRGWHHESIHAGVLGIQQLGVKHQFQVDLLEDNYGINDKNLANYQVVIFLNTTGDIFNEQEQKVMERFIQSGKGFMGIHSASDTEYDWEWYTKLVGRMFVIHPVIQSAKLHVLESSFPGLEGFANNKQWTDEWYEFGPDKVQGLKTILAVDESTYNPIVSWDANPNRASVAGKGMGTFHPIAWYHNFDGGRSFYTNLGHLPSNYTDPTYLSHIAAGIIWAATGKK